MDFGRKEITVHAETSKGRRFRTLPMTAELHRVLRAWEIACGDSRDEKLVLPWERATYREMYDDWAVIIKAAGLPKGMKPAPKNFRSTCGSELTEAGVPTVVVKDLLGHASVTTTERFYVNTSPALRAAADARVSFAERVAGEKAKEITKGRKKTGRKAS